MKQKLIKLLLIAAVTMPAASFGAVITSDYTFGVTNNYLSENFEETVNSSQSRSSATAIDQFDSSLGTLTDVSVSFTSTFSYYVSASSRDTERERRRCGWTSCSSYYDDDVGVTATLTQNFDVSLENYANVDVNLDRTFELDCSKVLNNSTSRSCQERDGWSTIAYATELDLIGENLIGFIGNGTLDLSFLNTNTISGTCNSHDEVYCYTSNYVTNWGGTITVDYTYDEVVASVSEPVGIALFSIPALVLLRRRQASKQA